MEDMTLLLERFRGRLPSEEPGARGLERVARNPGCLRLRTLVMIGVIPASAARDIYGFPAEAEESHFALSAGNKFERRLLENGVSGLLDLYRAAGRLGFTECRVCFVPDLLPRFQFAEASKRWELTDSLLLKKLVRDPEAPNILIKPRLPVPLLGLDHDIEPDALVAADAERFYTPVEIKSYPDRGGKTDPADVRNACRQVAVAVVALRHAASRLGVADPESLVPATADLILRRPGSNFPVLRSMPLKGEVYSIARVQNEADRTMDEVKGLIPPGSTLDDPTTLDLIPNNYLESCRENCALAGVCKRQAIATGNPVLLGNRVKEELAGAGSINRALALLHDRSDSTVCWKELRLRNALQEALRAYRKVVNHGR